MARVKKWARPTCVVAQRVHIIIEWACGRCGHEQAEGVHTHDKQGGCSGDHPEGEYCYCPPEQFVLHVDCEKCGQQNEVEAR